YTVYLRFLSYYNILASFWGIAADGLFWGWVPMLLAYFLVIGAAWLRVFSPSRRLLPLDDHQLFYRYVPMAGLLAVMGSYYAGRAVDFTAVLAFLPFAAIAIPAGLEMTSQYKIKRWAPTVVALIPILAAVWSFTYSLVVLYSKRSSFYQ